MMVNCQFLLENVVNCFIYIYSTFVQVCTKGMKHHLFRTNNFHSAWRFLGFIFEHIYRHFSLHHGNNQKSIQMLHFYIAVLVTAAPLSCFFLKFTSPGFSTLGSWVMFFASFQIRVFPLETCFTLTGWIRIPYTCWNASFFYSPPAGAS